jgi:hypothetical protein
MKRPFASHATGWIVLAGLIAFFPQLAGCDTTAPSRKMEGGAAEPQSTAPSTESPKSSQQRTQDSEPQGLVDASAKTTPTDPESNKTAPPASTGSEAPLVKRLVIASDIQQREPIEIESAKVKDPVVAFLELKHSGKEESGIVVTFEHESGKKVGFVELKVPAESPRFRTWARTRNIGEAGEWTAVVRSKSGEELARKSFTVAG